MKDVRNEERKIAVKEERAIGSSLCCSDPGN